MITTVKFGGTSLADAEHFRRCAAIVQADARRRYVVVSAPGKRFGADVKITDLLYACFDAAQAGADFSPVLAEIRRRFEGIVADLGLKLDLAPEFEIIADALKRRPDRDYAASRGEYLSAKVMAALLDAPMLDAAECIFFSADGEFNAEATKAVLSKRLQALPRAVLPGFYGSLPDGSAHTFSRGGSDVTGAIVARASASGLYENWTDVSGMLSCDPRVVESPAPIDRISYTELRELAYMGASVLHESAIFPVKAAGIPINIRNTNAPEDPGTLIQPRVSIRENRPVTGIAGRKGFSSIVIEKDQMNETLGFTVKVLEVLCRHGVLMEHIPTGIDTMSVVVRTELLAPCREAVLSELQACTRADSITVRDGIALIAVVGQGMVRHRGMSGRVFSALGRAGINVNMIDQGSDELNIIAGVDEADFEPALRTLYGEFFPRG